MQLDGTGSTDPDGDALTYAWDFGDGSTGSGVAPVHTYTADGRYTAALRVTDPSGASASGGGATATGSAGGASPPRFCMAQRRA